MRTYVYGGDGNRIKKTEGGSTIGYANKFYEKNVTLGVVTSHYYLGGQQVAIKKGSTLEYLHQDSLNSSSVSTASDGSQVSKTVFAPFGATRSSTGTLGTDQLYTGQRLDGTGLYFYNARYYDAGIGRFISPDDVTPNYSNPQDLNRYSYVHNNPLAYNDPTGHFLHFLAAIAGGALVGAITNTVAYAISNHNDLSWGGAAKAAASGAVSGALATTMLVPGVNFAAAMVGMGLASTAGYVSGEIVGGAIGDPDSGVTRGGMAASFVGGVVGGMFGQLTSAVVKAAGEATTGGLSSGIDKLADSLTRIENDPIEIALTSGIVSTYPSEVSQDQLQPILDPWLI